MFRRRQINGNPGGRAVRFLLALADAVRWPFERAAWAVERVVLWPLRERLAGLHLPGRGASAAALATIAAATMLTGVLLLAGDDGRSESGPVARVAIETAKPEPLDEEPSGPVLQGVSPNFDVAGSAPAAGASDAAAELNAGSVADAAPTGADEVISSEGGAGATSSARKPVPAGPAAMKVARRFSEAFVFYEIGERQARAETVFGQTASPQLAEALVEREPRQPAEGEVPKARVLNLVPGPRAGRAYTVSVSLLRLGLTSELRLELNKRQGNWLVTDVRG
jgi:hypothetical protein